MDDSMLIKLVSNLWSDSTLSPQFWSIPHVTHPLGQIICHPLGFPNSRPRPCAKSGGGSPGRSRPPLAANASGTTCLCPTVRVTYSIRGSWPQFISIAIAHSGGWAPSFQAKAVFCKYENSTQCKFYSVNSLRGSQEDVKGEENESMCLGLPCPSFLADAAHCITAKNRKAKGKKHKYIYIYPSLSPTRTRGFSLEPWPPKPA